MSSSIDKAAEHFNKLNTRERLTVMGGIVLVVVSLWMTMFFDVTAAENEVLESQLSGIKLEIRDHENIVREYETIRQLDPNKEVEERKKELLDQINMLNLNVSQEATNLIPPEKMVEVLTEMLKQSSGLRLLAVKNEAPELLMDASAAMEFSANDEQQNSSQKKQEKVGAKTAYANVYKHALILTLRGSYKEAMQYLKKLEELPWNFFWGNLSYKVGHHPDGVLILEVHTLSLDKQWIGVKKNDS